MRQGLAEGLARRRVPEPRRLVIAPGDHGLAVGAERHRLDRALMRQGWTEGLARRRVPEPRRLVLLPVITVLPSGLNATAQTVP